VGARQGGCSGGTNRALRHDYKDIIRSITHPGYKTCVLLMADPVTTQQLGSSSNSLLTHSVRVLLPVQVLNAAQMHFDDEVEVRSTEDKVCYLLFSF
jgi:hypothetical protein